MAGQVHRRQGLGSVRASRQGPSSSRDFQCTKQVVCLRLKGLPHRYAALVKLLDKPGGDTDNKASKKRRSEWAKLPTETPRPHDAPTVHCSLFHIIRHLAHLQPQAGWLSLSQAPLRRQLQNSLPLDDKLMHQVGYNPECLLS